MPLIPLWAGLILAHKFFCNYGIAQFITVSWVTVNNWLLTAKRHDQQDIKCRYPKSNNLMFCFCKGLILWPYWGLLLSLKSNKKLSAKLFLLHDVATLLGYAAQCSDVISRLKSSSVSWRHCNVLRSLGVWQRHATSWQWLKCCEYQIRACSIVD